MGAVSPVGVRTARTDCTPATTGLNFTASLVHGIMNEENVLFNDTFYTFYLRLYGIRHMIKRHSDSKRKILLLPHWLFFPISRVFYMHHPTERIIHTMAFVTPVLEHWLEQELGQLVHHEQTCLPLRFFRNYYEKILKLRKLRKQENNYEK